jgi:hypothetical protein
MHCSRPTTISHPSGPVVWSLLLLLLLAPVAFAERPPGQVIIEAGLTAPYGDLGDGFENTRLGFGAGNGFEAGFRYRLHLSPTFSVSPSFHFVDYENFTGIHPEIDEYRIQTSSLRYAVEFMIMSEYRSFGRPRPFLALAVGLYRNRVQGYYQDFIEAMDESVSTLGASFRGGVQILGFELSLVYNVNRFETWHFYRSDFRERYNWDNLGVRAGWIIPFE